MVNFYELVKNDPQYYKQFCCKDLLFLNYDCPVKLKKMAKWSEHHYIYYVLSGKKTLHTTEASFTMTEGSIAFIKKGACIVEQFFDDVFCIVVFIIPDSFIVSFLNEYLAEEQPNGLSSQLVIPIYDDIRVRSFYQSIIPYFASDEIPDSILELKFKELLLNIIHNPDNAELRNYLLTIRSQEASPVKEIIEANYAYNLTLEASAKLTNRSLSSFKRDFQSIYKTTPGRWLIEKKLVHAKRLLIQTDKSIADLAFESGFENTAHFSRLFKQKNGTTPIQYRKKASENQVLAI